MTTKRTCLKKIKKSLILLSIALLCGNTASAVSTEMAVYHQVLKYLPEETAWIVAQDIMDASAYYQVDPILIAAVCTCESGFQDDVISPAGAIGIMQLMPDTAQALGVNPYDRRDNIFGGVAYLAQQLDRFGGDYTLAEAAYNAGPGRIEEYGGIPPYAETQNYVVSVEAIRGIIWSDHDNEISPYEGPIYTEAPIQEVVANSQKSAANIPKTGADTPKKSKEEPETIRFYPPSMVRK